MLNDKTEGGAAVWRQLSVLCRTAADWRRMLASQAL